jgi:hypothetical protein
MRRFAISNTPRSSTKLLLTEAYSVKKTAVVNAFFHYSMRINSFILFSKYHKLRLGMYYLMVDTVKLSSTTSNIIV